MKTVKSTNDGTFKKINFLKNVKIAKNYFKIWGDISRKIYKNDWQAKIKNH